MNKHLLSLHPFWKQTAQNVYFLYYHFIIVIIQTLTEVLKAFNGPLCQTVFMKTRAEFLFRAAVAQHPEGWWFDPHSCL